MCTLDSTTDDSPWLNTRYVTEILTHYTRHELKELKSFTKAAATVKGENYASCMHVLNVEYSTNSNTEQLQSVSLIVKSRLNNEIMAQIEEDFCVFRRESQMYKFILDEATLLLRSIGENIRFGPRSFYVDDRVIVQENLKLRGYHIKDVKKGFNYEQCCMILDKLAKLHAVTMVLYKKNPDLFCHHLPGNICEKPSPLHTFYKNSISACIDYCENNPQLRQYVPGLKAFAEKIIPKLLNVFSRNQVDRFHVLNHGDMWVNNIMFHKTDAQEDDVLFVDYQEGFYGSPGIDWNYFIFSSWQPDVFQNKLPELLHGYHKTLTNVLEKLNYEQRIPTVDDVMKEIINKGFHGLSTATCLLPILINEHQHLTDPMNFINNTDQAIKSRRIVYDNPNFGKRLQPFLDFFAKNGFL